MAGTKAHVSESKKKEIKTLINDFKNNKTLMVISIKGLPSKQFQDIKKKLRNKAKVSVTKKSLLNRALDESGIEGLKGLVQYIDENCALLYSNSDAFEISGILAREKSPQKAKTGQIAPIDIEVKAGPTELVPGPDISALSAAGLAPKVENGKISVMQDKVIAKEGDTITDALASIMAKLDIIPFEVGIEPVAAFMDGRVYADIRIDVEAILSDLEEKFGRALPFAVEVGYITNETLDFVLAKAGMNENAIEALVGEEKVEESKEEEKSEEPVSEDGGGEEVKAEESNGDETKEEEPEKEKKEIKTVESDSN